MTGGRFTHLARRLALLALALLGPALVLVGHWAPRPFTSPLFGGALLVLGSLVAVLNALLSWWGSRKRRSVPADRRGSDGVRRPSGFPLVGMLAIPGLFLLPPCPLLSLWVLVSLVLDTGNLTWFVVAVWRDEAFLGGLSPS